MLSYVASTAFGLLMMSACFLASLHASLCESSIPKPRMVPAWLCKVAGQWALGSDGLLCFAWCIFGVCCNFDILALGGGRYSAPTSWCGDTARAALLIWVFCFVTAWHSSMCFLVFSRAVIQQKSHCSYQDWSAFSKVSSPLCGVVHKQSPHTVP